MTHRTTGIASVLSAALDEQATQFAEALEGVRSGDDAELRRARVAARRLRERLALAEEAGADVPARRARRQLREVTRTLGPLRELTVAQSAFADAARRHGWPDARVTALRRWIDKEGARRRARVALWLDSFDDRRLARLLRETSDGLTAPVADRSWAATVSARVVRRLRRVERAADACGVLYAPGRLHALRIAIKKLRYVLELAQPALGVDAAVALRVLKRVQTHCGALHDLQMLQTLVTAAAAVGRGSALRMNAHIVSDALERDCRAMHAVALRDSAGLAPLLDAVRRGLVDAAAARKTPVGAGRRAPNDARRSGRPAAAAS